MIYLNGAVEAIATANAAPPVPVLGPWLTDLINALGPAAAGPAVRLRRVCCSLRTTPELPAPGSALNGAVPRLLPLSSPCGTGRLEPPL